MEMLKHTQTESAAKLAKKIVEQFGKFQVKMEISEHIVMKERVVFKVKLKGKSRESQLRDRAPDVQSRLRLPLFSVEKYGFELVIVTSWLEVTSPHLPEILKASDSHAYFKEAILPYAVGFNAIGDTIVEDLASFPHLLLGGSTNSGKSVGLQALIACIAYTKSPSRANFILIDVGATSLMPFEGLPHLSCPVVREHTTAMHVLAALIDEMERRVDLEYADLISFKQLPRLVVVIDEFPALFMGLDKTDMQALTANISNLIQRGRHAKIHLVLAAQNPTFANMRVDLGNITARIAFKCAKKNFSETILGEGGAENLLGRGDMLFRSPAHDLQRIQGTYVTEEELAELVERISLKHSIKKLPKFTLEISEDDLTGTTGEHLSCSVVRKRPPKEDRQLADVIMWTLKHTSISANMLMKERHFGWNTASRLVKQMEDIGTVEKMEGKLPRDVIPSCPEDLPEKLQKSLAKAGYSSDALRNAFKRGNRFER